LGNYGAIYPISFGEGIRRGKRRAEP